MHLIDRMGGREGLGAMGRLALLELITFDQTARSDFTASGMNSCILLFALNFLMKLYKGCRKACVNGAIEPKFSRLPASSWTGRRRDVDLARNTQIFLRRLSVLSSGKAHDRGFELNLNPKTVSMV